MRHGHRWTRGRAFLERKKVAVLSKKEKAWRKGRSVATLWGDELDAAVDAFIRFLELE